MNGPVFIITCVVARLTFFLKPAHQSPSALFSVFVSGGLGDRSRRRGGASYLPTTSWAIVWGEHFNRIGVEQGGCLVVFEGRGEEARCRSDV